MSKRGKISGRHGIAGLGMAAIACLAPASLAQTQPSAQAPAPPPFPAGPIQPDPQAAVAVQTAAASNNLNINPKRLTFDRLGKSASIYVFNQGQDGATFDVKLIDRLMLPNGEIVSIDDAADKPDLKPLVDKLKSAREMLLATPRRVTLSGDSGQTIRVRASSPADVPPGEYRTHLTVTAIPPADAGITAEQAAGPRDNQLSFRVNTGIALSIPVILRVGPIDMRAGIENAHIATQARPEGVKDGPPHIAVLSFDLVRAGVNSIFGDLTIRGDKERGDKEPLGTVRGIAVYPEIERRFVKVALRRIPAPGEQIEIVFRDDDVSPGKQLVRVTLPAP